MPDNLLQQAINTLVPVLVALLTALIGVATQALRSKLHSEQAREVLDRLSSQARDVVLELEQTWVGNLRAAAEDGKLDGRDVTKLKEEALANLRRYLGTRGKADALRVLGFQSEEELDALLRAKLEAEVQKLRRQLGAKAVAAIEEIGK